MRYTICEGKELFIGLSTHSFRLLITIGLYLSAFSTIYAGSGRQSDKYELISQLVYEDIPVNKQVTFEQWASLMNKVYKIKEETETTPVEFLRFCKPSEAP